MYQTQSVCLAIAKLELHSCAWRDGVKTNLLWVWGAFSTTLRAGEGAWWVMIQCSASFEAGCCGLELLHPEGACPGRTELPQHRLNSSNMDKKRELLWKQFCNNHLFQKKQFGNCSVKTRWKKFSFRRGSFSCLSLILRGENSCSGQTVPSRLRNASSDLADDSARTQRAHCCRLRLWLQFVPQNLDQW